eukprot:11214271-Lingulodinium_polyedra.AAC.1
MASGGSCLKAAGVQGGRLPPTRRPGRARSRAWSERCSNHLCSRVQSSGREAGFAKKSSRRAPCRS